MILKALSFFFLLIPLSEARVFDFKSQSMGSYIRGTAGISSVGKTPFLDSSGSGTTIEESSPYNLGGEFGFLLTPIEQLGIRLGLEVMRASKITNATGENSVGATRFVLESESFIYNPMATIEIYFHRSAVWRGIVFAGMGYGNVTIDNVYEMTATGTSELGVSSFSEKMEALAWNANAGLGYEILLTDNVTISGEVGYRYFPVNRFKLKSDVASIAQPSGTKGETVINSNGSTRTVNFGGAFFGASLRFYFNL